MNLKVKISILWHENNFRDFRKTSFRVAEASSSANNTLKVFWCIPSAKPYNWRFSSESGHLKGVSWVQNHSGTSWKNFKGSKWTPLRNFPLIGSIECNKITVHHRWSFLDIRKEDVFGSAGGWWTEAATTMNGGQNGQQVVNKLGVLLKIYKVSCPSRITLAWVAFNTPNWFAWILNAASAKILPHLAPCRAACQPNHISKERSLNSG